MLSFVHNEALKQRKKCKKALDGLLDGDTMHSLAIAVQTESLSKSVEVKTDLTMHG